MSDAKTCDIFRNIFSVLKKIIIYYLKYTRKNVTKEPILESVVNS